MHEKEVLCDKYAFLKNKYTLLLIISLERLSLF